MNVPFAARRDRLRRRLRRAGADAILITSPTNVTYLTGFTGDSSYLLLTRTGQRVLSDSRYTVQLQEQCPDVEIEIRTSAVKMIDHVTRRISKDKLSQLAIESDHLSKSVFDQLSDKLPRTKLSGSTEWVERLRAIKDRSEVHSIRRSIHAAQRAFDVVRANLRGDQQERQIAHSLENQIRKFGGQRCSFDPIVAAGPRSALPHAEVTERTIGDASFVLLDWGAMVDGYASDLTRILVTAKISPKLQRIYGVVLRAQRAAIDLIRPGVSFREVDHAARRIIGQAGFEKQFGHGLGHGFGLQIHELPSLSPVSQGQLKAGMVVTVEPGIYLPGWGGVRIEDDVLVTRSGHQVLSSVAKELDECVVDIH